MEYSSMVAQTPLHDLKVDVTVIIVSYNTAHLLDRMFDTLDSGKGDLIIQVIVVDNASRDHSVEHLRQYYPDVRLIANSVNVGFGRANNQALPFVNGRHILLLNTDAFMCDKALADTVKYMDSHGDCGVLGVKLVDEKMALQPSCRYFPSPWNVFLSKTGLGRFFPATQMIDDLSWDHRSVRDCDWVPGCYYLVRREVVDQIGLFDPRYFVYYEEVDHCLAAKAAGWRVVYFPSVYAVHLGGESASSDGAISSSGRQLSRLQIESELLYFRKHYGLSGVLLHIVLTMIANSYVAGKATVLYMNLSSLKSAAKLTWHVIALFFSTKLGSRATR